MKKYFNFIFLFIIVCLCVDSCSAIKISNGRTKSVEILSDNVSRVSNANWLCASGNYLVDGASNGSGITFSYPTNWFSVAPLVVVSVEPHSALSAKTTLVATLEGNNATGVKIVIHKIAEGAVAGETVVSLNSDIACNVYIHATGTESLAP